MKLKDATKTIVDGFPKQLKKLQIIIDKSDEETYINKELFVDAVKEYIAQADFWNDVKKSKPEEGKPFLYYTVNGKVMVCRNTELDEWFVSKYGVTHWMYLPNPPKP